MYNVVFISFTLRECSERNMYKQTSLKIRNMFQLIIIIIIVVCILHFGYGVVCECELKYDTVRLSGDRCVCECHFVNENGHRFYVFSAVSRLDVSTTTMPYECKRNDISSLSTYTTRPVREEFNHTLVHTETRNSHIG